ncbi:hypothetical protein BV22DRAFT_377540 [Leucogyrophana mollusca]|uniref:Uncharacterized protein n=1 Tax=Leucogyrophana mollusca TaxID=85980 RepID=A0ACB8BLP4_9AGAM|nr:hypothetical protein BV22DRAFT_377540 [Leucogyrophana mollusca]
MLRDYQFSRRPSHTCGRPRARRFVDENFMIFSEELWLRLPMKGVMVWYIRKQITGSFWVCDIDQYALDEVDARLAFDAYFRGDSQLRSMQSCMGNVGNSRFQDRVERRRFVDIVEDVESTDGDFRVSEFLSFVGNRVKVSGRLSLCRNGRHRRAIR